MRYRSEFEVDLYRLQRETNPEGLITHLKNVSARDLGAKICEKVSFKKQESDIRKGIDLNNYPPINPQDAAKDRYRLDLFAVDTEDWMEFRNKLADIAKNAPEHIAKSMAELIREIEAK